ncbi:hypothetical protein ACFPRL_36035 [Pseudoclavibacter helvolus]
MEPSTSAHSRWFGRHGHPCRSRPVVQQRFRASALLSRHGSDRFRSRRMLAAVVAYEPHCSLPQGGVNLLWQRCHPST